MKTLKNLIKLVLFVCLASASGNLYAQTDYIIGNDEVKIMGEVKTHNVNKVKFRAAGENKTKKYRPEEIKEAYKAGHGIFRSVFVPKRKSTSFLQLLEDGKIKLYEYFEGGYTGAYGSPVMSGGGMVGGMGGGMGSNPRQYWYAQKDGGEIVEVKSNQIWGSRKNRKDNFLKLVQDNQHITERYEKEDKFNFDFVRSLIVEYNASAPK